MLRRRDVLTLGFGGVAGLGSLWVPGARGEKPARIRAVAFDAFPIFDPRPVFALAEQLFPGKGAALSDAWRTRQFEYQWLRALAGHYVDFWQATEEALVFAGRATKVDLTDTRRAQLMQAYLHLDAWPDVPAVLRALRAAGLRVVFVSNMTTTMLETGIRNARLDGLFDHVLSTDRIRTHKPDPRAYQLAIDALHMARDEILFAPFAGWDAAGAKWFGYPTFWVNRMNVPGEVVGVEPDAMGPDLTSLLDFVRPLV
jgi:2-haloacid dehalogenase